MDISWTKLYKVLTTDPKAASILKRCGIEAKQFTVYSTYPPSSGQDACRDVLRDLGFTFDDDEDVTITK